MDYRCFIGFEPRHAIGLTVTSFSLIHYASHPLQITPLVLGTLPIDRRGLTEFTYSRFLVPWLCNYRGWAVFLDSDIVLQDDICKLWEYADPTKAVIVAEGVPGFERAAFMMFNCAHEDNLQLTPIKIANMQNLHTIGWTKEIAYFPESWAHCVGYSAPSDEVSAIHFTKGNPVWPETRQCEHQEKWVAEYKAATGTVSYNDLMGGSVHAEAKGPD